MNDTNPDYIVVGETRNYNYERLERAVHLVRKGAKLIGTNPDLTDIIAGIESEIETVLVLSGVTSREDLDRFAYRPRYILEGVGDIVP
jgi:ribonucleotide monophosphatase NagD (HAD superfamily)